MTTLVMYYALFKYQQWLKKTAVAYFGSVQFHFGNILLIFLRYRYPHVDGKDGRGLQICRNFNDNLVGQ